MIQNIRFLKTTFFLLIMPLFLLTACKHENLDIYQESDSYRNAADFIANNYELSLFNAALQRSGMLEELRGQGPFTVFAPGNAAFNELGITRPADFDRMDKDSLRQMLQYHILPRRLYRDDVPNITIDNKYLNLAGKELYLGFRKYYISMPGTISNQLYVNGVNAPNSAQNVALANGVLHLLSGVLKYKPSVQQVLESQPQYSLLVAGLKHFGQWQQLSGAVNHTILAPGNDAFAAAGINLQDIMAMNPDSYHARLFGAYVAKGHLFTSDWLVLPPPNAASSQVFSVPIIGDETYSITLSSNGFVTIENGAGQTISYTTLGANYQLNYKADNGVVHAINEILVLPADAKK